MLNIPYYSALTKDVDDKLYSIKTRGLKDTFFNTSMLNEQAIEVYNNEIAKGATAQNALAIASKNANRATIALMESANGTTISTEQMIAAQKASTVAARAQSVAYKAVAIAGNMIAGIVISFAINAVIKGIDNLIHRTEKIKEAAEEAQQTIDDAQKTLQNVSTTISENKERFLELSEGVSRFSENLHLSEDDYAEYLSISQKLADISPELIVGYDEQGNALLDIGNNAEETTQKLNELLETQQAISKQTLADNLNAVAQGVYVEVDETKGAITQLKQQLEDAKQESSEINFDIADIVKNGNAIFQFNDTNDPLKTYRSAFKKALESANIGWEDLGNDQIFVNDFSGAVGNGGSDGYEVRDIALKEAQAYYNALLNLEDNVHAASIAGLEKEIAEKEKTINASYSKMTANLQAWVEQNYNYQYLTDNSQDIIDALIPNIDWDNLGIDLYSGQDYQQYITDNIIAPLMSVPKEHKQEIDNMFQQLLSFEDGDLRVLDFAEKLQAKLNEYGINIDITPIISDELGQKAKLDSLVDKFGQDAVNGLTPEELQIALTISTEEADKAIEEEKKKVETELQSLSKEGNVDLTIRPVIDSSAMQAAGWDVEDGSIATTFTQGEFIWQGDEENGQYVYVHYTPILPDGTVLTPDELTNYLYGTLEGSEDILGSDDKGLVLKVDTDLNIPEEDIKKFQNGEGSTQAIDDLILKTGEWDDKVHDVQEQYYDTGDGIGYIETALDGLIEKHSELGKGNETAVS